jgi:two-component system NtrC family sensor kinase
MTDCLEERSSQLEKAVAELRDTNGSLRRARDGLDRAERLAAVGNLAAGVAHEVGNPMGALLAFLELARRDPSLSEEAQGHLGRASEQGSRVREILRQLLDFSRPPRSVPQAMDLEQTVRQTVGLLQAQSRFENIQFEFESAESIPPVLGDEGVAAQILLNLLLNAGHAALEGEGDPRVMLSLRPAPLLVRSGDDPEQSRRRKSLDGVECIIVDSGPGIPSADLERIFDPFFTTKDPGVGTGLGLANALRLAEGLGGVVEVGASDRLPGAAFVLRLPRANREPDSRVRQQG